MKTISVFVFWVFAALVFLSGCQSDPPKEEVEIEGQVFVVTKGRENIKMGLTPIYVLSDEEFQKIAAELAEEIQAFRVEGIQREANWEARTKFIRELLAMEGRELAESALEALRMEAARPSSEYVVKNRFLVHEDLERSKVLLFSMIPDATTKTDADGRFKISVSSKSWVIAQGQRSVGKESEDYLWIAPIGDPEKATKSSLLISNDSGYDSTEELYALLNSVSDSGSDVLPAVGSGEVDQETAQWIKEANERAKQAIRMVEQELTSIRESLSYESLKLKGGGTVVAWGKNDSNQCDVPSGLTDVVGIAAGLAHSLALKKDGTVVAWGNNDYNQCDVPSGLTDVVGIAADLAHSLALKKDGTVVDWGDNQQEQCDVPSGLTDVVGITAGVAHNLALKRDGTVVAWGNNLLNQCDV
ncbi:hypothetical protein N9Z33_02880, partial [Akkermansiaceae bacterium]|nr:hypothetical protein [Akkermansiaceae bacterium]